MASALLGVAASALGALASTAADCPPTRPDMLGPFYEPGAPERDRTGQGLVVTGVVRSAAGCAPLAGARLEWWSAGPRGEYDAAHRATQVAGPDGRYRYETDPPPAYGGRPPHVHVRVSAPAHRTLVTQVYPRAGQREIAFDLVLERP